MENETILAMSLEAIESGIEIYKELEDDKFIGVRFFGQKSDKYSENGLEIYEYYVRVNMYGAKDSNGCHIQSEVKDLGNYIDSSEAIKKFIQTLYEYIGTFKD